MKTLKEFYTIVILTHPTSNPHRLRISKQSFKILAVALSIVALLLSGLLLHYLTLVGEMVELKTLRREASIQKRQLQTFLSEILDLKNQITRLREMDAKLRVITDIAPPSETTAMSGMGGTDTTALSMMDVWSQPEELTQKMLEEIKVLKQEATRQEVSFEELTQAMKDRKSLWASTPSIWPVKGWLTSAFGNRLSPFTGRVALHNGIDIATRRDTPIVAPATGLVSYVGYNSGLGRMIKISHRQGMQTVYGHLAKADVKIGQRVKRGDVIGYVGNTGMSTGPHLHYEVFINGLPVNPLHYIID